MPSTPYEFAQWKKVRVHIDHHIELERHYYSVPHALVGKQLHARYTAHTVECLHRGQRVASHVVDKSLGLRRNWLRGNAHHEHRIPRRPGACQSLSGPSLFRHTDKPNRWLPPNPATASSHTQTLTLAPAKHSYHGSRNLHVRTIKKTAPCASYTRFSGAIYSKSRLRPRLGWAASNQSVV